MVMSKVIDYHFKLETPERYRCQFDMVADSKTFRRIYKLSRKALKAKRVKTPQEAGQAERWSIKDLAPNRAQAVMKQMDLAAKQLFKIVRKEVGADGIKILNRKLQDAIFQRDDPDADVNITLYYMGDCHDDR